MTAKELKISIKDVLHSFNKGNLTENGLALFDTLGYITDRQAPLDNPSYDGFKESFIEDQKFDEAKAKTDEWLYIDLLFQLSSEEITKQNSLFNTNRVDDKIIESYLFFVVKLSGEHYNRTDISVITREINRLFPMPVMILFNYDLKLTLSVIDRRLHKKDESKDVLEKVTLIKDINIESPHRAHIEILNDLSYDKLYNAKKFSNFVELHKAWQETLDTKELNKRFFNELANWYFWAISVAEFPDDELKDKEVRNATNVIRLITRLIFVWFLKEKNLVPAELFNLDELKELLKFSDKNQSTYYKAILQNLFFATLNTEMGKRKFRSNYGKSLNSHYFIHNLFRYETEFYEPQQTLEKYFDPIPFLNGGLFECLDKIVETDDDKQALRIDGFSDRADNVIKVPDELFFTEGERVIDLSEVYGSAKKNKEKVRGLIDILNRYKFTITENTPIEEEVALDPELLGKVFENLLANYNPETKTTARKQTGSFYTPREIVNYMVDESLIAYLKQKLNDDNSETQLRDLLSYSENPNPFDELQTEVLINAIDEIKILDPACGSGAFPMGILHKLVHVLHKIDPKNEQWEKRQLQKVHKLISDAETISDTKTRETIIENLSETRKDVEQAFENNELDYGRKLFLIENCIYGVDIQPIAVQIAKLRFFISLIVEQHINRAKYNLGVRPLPNLETKFVAANTLIALEKEQAHLFTNPEIDIKKEQLKKTRHEYFEARTPKRKENCRIKDKQLRSEIAELLITEHQLLPTNATKLAAWDPYDQNISADFFDPEWMFSISDGFDVVIGNPPFIDAKKLKNVNQYLRLFYETYSGSADLFVYFYEKGLKTLKYKGLLCLISSNKWIRSEYGRNLRKFFLEKNDPLYLVDFGTNRVFDATVDSNIFLISKSENNHNFKICVFTEKFKEFEKFDEYLFENFKPCHNLTSDIWRLSDDKSSDFKNKIEKIGKPLIDFGFVIYRGILTGLNNAFFVDNETKELLIKQDEKNKEIIKPLIQGKNIRKYQSEKSNLWLINTHNGIKEKKIMPVDVKEDFPKIYEHLERFLPEIQIRGDKGVHWSNLRNCAYLLEFEKEKILWQGVAKRIEFSYDTEKLYGDVTTFFMTGKNLKYFIAILNSKFFGYTLLNVYLEGDTFKSKNQILQNFPIPEISEIKQEPFKKLVDEILRLKKEKQNTTNLEKQIDELVYQLYELTEVEIAIIENSMNKK